ncbi:STAS domain-containing protein [Chloroflexota bacterium]
MKDTAKVQEQVISELVEVHPGVLVLQLNGKQNSHAMRQLAERLRERIEKADPLIAVVDVTGVLKTDTKIVQYLADIVGAARFPDIQVVLVRRDPAIDRKLTNLGINLTDITMCQSLVAGLWMALDIVEPWTASKPNKVKITSRDKDKTKEQPMNELIEIRQLVAK